MRSKTVAVVDYGSGNLRSVSQAVVHVAQGSGLNVIVTSRAQDVFDADLPPHGVHHRAAAEPNDIDRKTHVPHYKRVTAGNAERKQ